MAVGVSAAELRTSTEEELVTKLREAKEELFNLRFQAATGQLESHGRLRGVRREIARIYTVMRERELGIITVDESEDEMVPAGAGDEAPSAEEAGRQRAGRRGRTAAATAAAGETAAESAADRAGTEEAGSDDAGPGEAAGDAVAEEPDRDE